MTAVNQLGNVDNVNVGEGIGVLKQIVLNIILAENWAFI